MLRCMLCSYSYTVPYNRKIAYFYWQSFNFTDKKDTEPFMRNGADVVSGSEVKNFTPFFVLFYAIFTPFCH